MGRLRSVAAALILLSASVVFALGLAEVCLRLFPGLMPEEAQLRLHWRDRSVPITLADPYLGYVFPPNHVDRIVRSNGDFGFTFRTDEHGFRNRPLWPERADIVVLGDSMAFGYGVDDDKTWTALLANRLQGSRIINLGVPDAGPQQYLRIYERFGQALHPALVLLCLFPGNDVGDAGRFDRWVKAGSHGNYLTQRFVSKNFHSQRGIGHVLGGIGHVLQQSYLVSFLRYAPKKVLSRTAGRTIDFPDGGRIQLVPALYADMAQHTKPDNPNFRLVLDAVEQTRALAERNDSHFLVLVMPTKEEVYLPLLDEPPVPSAVAAFLAAFDAARIPYLDLTPHLQASARQGTRLFFEVDGHPNAAGYRLMADVVFDHLRRHPDRYHLTHPQAAATAPN
jgi:lysophospholipase L1-like esterase